MDIKKRLEDNLELKTDDYKILLAIENNYSTFRYNNPNDNLNYSLVCPEVENNIRFLKDKIYTNLVVRHIDALFYLYLLIINPNNMIKNTYPVKKNIIAETKLDLCEIAKKLRTSIVKLLEPNYYKYESEIANIQKCVDDKLKEICIYQVPNEKNTIFYSLMGAVGLYMTFTSFRHLFLNR